MSYKYRNYAEVFRREAIFALSHIQLTHLTVDWLEPKEAELCAGSPGAHGVHGLRGTILSRTGSCRFWVWEEPGEDSFRCGWRFQSPGRDDWSVKNESLSVLYQDLDRYLSQDPVQASET